MSILQYNTTPSANTSVDGVNIAEGMPPGNVNNGMRAMMADSRKWQLDMGGSGVTAGTGNTYTLTAEQGFTAYAEGQRFTFRSNRANTGNATINIGGKGAVQLRKFSGGVSVALDAGDIGSGEIVDVVYVETPASFVLINKADTTASSLTMTGPGLVGRAATGAGKSRILGIGGGLQLDATTNVIRVFIGDGLSYVASGAETLIKAVVDRFSTQAEAEAGVDNASAMTPLRVLQSIFANTFGRGQQWQDVSGSRAANVWYTNSTSRPIQLAIKGPGNQGGRIEVRATPTGPIVVVAEAFDWDRATAMPVIPVSSQYRFTNSFQTWVELR